MVKSFPQNANSSKRRNCRQSARKDRKDITPDKAGPEEHPHLETLVLTCPAVSYICKASGNYGATYVSANIKAQLGYEPEDFTRDPGFWVNNIHPDDRQRVQRDLAALFKNNQHVHEYRFQHKDGTYRWMHDEMRLIRDSKGKPVEVVGHWMDVTTRKEVDDNLRESEARYKTLFESSPDGILIADIETRTFQYANPAACKMLGWSEKELRNIHVDDIHPKESLDYVLSEFEAQARGKKTLSEAMPCLRKDGTVFFADVNAVKCVVDTKECNIGFFRDITKRKQAEESLREKDVYLRVALSSAPIVLFTEDVEGVIEFVAGKGLEALELTPEAMLGRSIFDVFPDVTGHRENRARALSGESFTATLNVKGRTQEIWYTPLRNMVGQIVGVIGVVTDVTERAQAEKALLDKNVALREVLGRIEEQKSEMGRTMLANVDKIIMPLVHVLEQGLSPDQHRYMSLLKQSLEEIVSPFVSRLSTKLVGLTPAEIRICNLIRRGLSNKEIAQLEHIAPATVNKHRTHIRYKLGIANKKINLASHLESFMSPRASSQP